MGRSTRDRQKTIVFVCLHGVYFNKALDSLNPANPLAALTASDASGASRCSLSIPCPQNLAPKQP
jgi:hypothetical protein